jgi:Na+-transporting methylmalonyl-CoA/oxaloacetate decarboxylase gamma subunit
MADVGLIAILVAFFLLAIVLVRVLGRMIDRDVDPEGFTDEPPDTSEAAEAAGEPR